MQVLKNDSFQGVAGYLKVAWLQHFNISLKIGFLDPSMTSTYSYHFNYWYSVIIDNNQCKIQAP